jgi:NADH:ubiquinone reductase (H+-translocating)
MYTRSSRRTGATHNRQDGEDFGQAKDRKQVVVIGGGFGGLRAAHGLRHAPVDVTIIDRSNHHVFQPLLYQVATAMLSPADISGPIRSIARHQRSTEVALADVTGIDTERRLVFTHDLAGTYDRSFPYDYLIISTGAEPSYFGHDEWASFAPGLKTLEDAIAIRRKVLLAFEAAEAEMAHDPEKARQLLTFVVIGGGPTGVEMAGAIAEVAHDALIKDFRHIDSAAAHVLLVEAAPRLLLTYSGTLAQKAADKLHQLGVEVRCNARVESVDAEGLVVQGKRIPTKTVIWAAGVKASPAGLWLGADTDRSGRVLVQPDLSLPQYPNIFVIGDTASIKSQGQPVPGIAPAAMQEGNFAAQVIRARVSGRQAPTSFIYHDKGSLATVGRAFAIADIHQRQLSGLIAWMLWLIVHIFFLIGFRNRTIVMFQWAWSYLTFQRGARLITGTLASEGDVLYPSSLGDYSAKRRARLPSAKVS